jgi:hypothetical protein
MKKLNSFVRTYLVLGIISLSIILSCKPSGKGKDSKARKQDSITSITSNIAGTGQLLEIQMTKGKAHNHPTFAIWIEDTSNNYLQTLFVTSAIGQGIFTYGDKSGGKWKPGEVHRPAALPYWAHKRGIINENGSFVPTPKSKVADAYSGATPPGSFKLDTRTDVPVKGKVKILMEVNQTWDWNEYWTNAKYVDDADYKTSCQPAIVYSAILDLDSPGSVVQLKPVGHSHYSGKSGELFTDLTTLTTAMHIADEIQVTVK